MLRTTAAEALLDEFKKSAEQRIQAAEKVIEGLKKENEALRKKTESLMQTKAGRVSDVSTLSSEQTEALRPIVDLYGRLSGLEISTDLDRDNLWHCSINGKQGGKITNLFWYEYR